MTTKAPVLIQSKVKQALGYPNLRRILVLKSHAAHARFIAETNADGPVREIPCIPEIPSPYSYSAEWTVWCWQGREVIIRETAHLRFEVWEVLP